MLSRTAAHCHAAASTITRRSQRSTAARSLNLEIQIGKVWVSLVSLFIKSPKEPIKIQPRSDYKAPAFWKIVIEKRIILYQKIRIVKTTLYKGFDVDLIVGKTVESPGNSFTLGVEEETKVKKRIVFLYSLRGVEVVQMSIRIAGE